MFHLLGSLQKSLNVSSESEPESLPSEEAKPSDEKMVKKFPLDGLTSNATLFAGKFVNYAKKVTTVAQEQAEKLSTFVNEQKFLNDLECEKQNFMETLSNEKKCKLNEVHLPWDDMPDIDVMRKNILALSLDERNFLADSPSNETIEFNNEVVAQELLKTDPQLRKMRYNLVPKRITEENFWKNYFYRIFLLRQLILGKNRDETNDGDNDSNGPSISSPNNEKKPSPITNALSGSEKVLSSTDEDWERELLSDINEFEMVDNNSSSRKSEAEWDEEINALLEAEAAKKT